LKLINLMGSHGTKAIAAAVLGAQATCVDISPVNASYGSKVAAAAGVEVEFVVADVLQLSPEQLAGGYDVVLLELGVLHYFLDLAPLMTVVAQLLRPGGTLLLREFHPVDTKLLKGKGKARKVAGDYFSQGLVSSSVAYSKYSKDAAGTEVLLRQWGLGEVVTAVCEAGLVVQRLQEEPTVALEDAGLPKLFTLVAARPSQQGCV
jgi:2-polyprenyl-3-methyl-5-hydroxy-6-metoxy-1,4-benzoquinol methylase